MKFSIDQFKMQKYFELENDKVEYLERQKVKFYNNFIGDRLLETYRLLERWKNLPDYKTYRN